MTITVTIPQIVILIIFTVLSYILGRYMGKSDALLEVMICEGLKEKGEDKEQMAKYELERIEKRYVNLIEENAENKTMET